MKQGFVIPVYRHGKTAGPLAERLSAFGLPVIIVDDGNNEEEKAFLAECTAKLKGVFLVSLEKNMGKGAAVALGFEKAAELCLSHAFQVDADGQHDEGAIPFFLEESRRHPESIICGLPVFDETAPRGRVKGRKVSNFWAALVTLSTELRDVLCGFRIYPVNESLRITKHFLLDKRMGFDAEILVRLYWNKIFPIYHPVNVHYPKDGVSNFHPVSDNLHMSWVFFRLFMCMLPRLPFLIALRIRRLRERR